MKTHKHLFKLLPLFFCFSTSSYARTSASVDSMFQVIKNSWYQTKTCSGLTGQCDSVYSELTHIISRVPGTDSIRWETYSNNRLTESTQFLLSKKASILNGQAKWMLSKGRMNLLINSDGQNLSIVPDAYDAGSKGYKRLMNERAPTQRQIDSIAACIAGDWYEIYNCNGFTGVCDSVNSATKYSLTHIAGTDSIIWQAVVGTCFVYDKYRIIQTANNIKHQKSWMLTTDVPLPSPDGIHDLYIHTMQRIFIDCTNNQLSQQIEGYDTPYLLYAHSPRAISDTLNTNLGFRFHPNPVINTIQISGGKNIESIHIIDLNGYPISSYNGDIRVLHLGNLRQGIYFIQIKSEGKSQILRMLKK